MSYKFKADENVEEAFRRIGASQIRMAIESLEKVNEDPAEAIHDARKRCKKLRALVRLVRPVFSGYARENAAFRDAAKPLSGVRDRQAMLEAFEDLGARSEVGRDHSWLRERLVVACEERIRHLPAVEDSLELLRGADLRCSSWELEGQGFGAVESGLKMTYQRARKDYRRSRKDASASQLHAWRALVKYHGYHLQLLAPLWAPLSRGQRAAAREVGELLGDHHDLVHLRQWLGRLEHGEENEDAISEVQSLAQQRMAELQEDALASGRVLMALKPKELSKVFERWWKAAAK